MKLASSQRWALIPVAAIAGCAGTTTVTGALGRMLEALVNPASLESAIPTDVRYGLVNAAGAFVFVVAGAWLAPRHRIVVATGLFAVGALIADSVLNPWWFPEGHPRAYQPSYAPLALTLIAGAIGVLVSAVASRGSALPSAEP